jgi:ribosomal protein L11 methyltransferase
VPAAEAEIARARLMAVVPAGFEELDLDVAVELAAYVDAAGEEELRRVFGEVGVAPVEPGWEERWRDFHRSVRVGGLWIGPPWEAPPSDEPVVVVDPGRAFGTGGHPTTRACIELLARAERGSVLDAGCGSGVVAVAATRLGFDPVFAVDDDPAAIEAATRTAAANDAPVRVARADVLVDELPRVDLVIANIELQVVENLLARFPAPRAIVSGYLVDDMPSAAGWERVERLELEGWAADVLVSS